MNNPTPPNPIDRFRGWTLAALYGAIAILSALLVYAGWRIWPATNHAETAILLLAGTGSATAVYSMRTCINHVRMLRAGGGTPQLAVSPFLGITLTLMAAGYLFGEL